MRLSQDHLPPPGYAVSPPLLVPVSNWERYRPSRPIASSTSRPPANTSRSGWKFSVTRRSGSTGPPEDLAATWAMARWAAGTWFTPQGTTARSIKNLSMERAVVRAPGTVSQRPAGPTS